MNRLSTDRQATVIAALVEGNSVRSVERMTGVHRDTIIRLVGRLGSACQQMMDERLQDLACTDIQVDELWCYVGKKQRHVTAQDDRDQVGNFWTWVAMDSDSKLVPSYRVGQRDLRTAVAFMKDLASRILKRVQISSDKLHTYRWAIQTSFGARADYGTVVKTYEAEGFGPGRYSPPKVTKIEREAVRGNPDMDSVSTSYIERQNLTIRMQMRRFTRLTNGWSKKRENLEAAVAVHFAHYNFVRKHGTVKTTPAVAAGVERHPWSVNDLVALAN